MTDTTGRVFRFGRAMAAAILLMAAGAGAAGANGDGAALSGSALKSFISGKRVYLAVPFGGEIPLKYHTSGRVDGSGEAVGLGKYMAPKDSGRWWVAGDRLCQQWQQWYKGKVFCFTVSRLSDSRIRWVRDDGKSGMARVQ